MHGGWSWPYPTYPNLSLYGGQAPRCPPHLVPATATAAPATAMCSVPTTQDALTDARNKPWIVGGTCLLCNKEAADAHLQCKTHVNRVKRDPMTWRNDWYPPPEDQQCIPEFADPASHRSDQQRIADLEARASRGEEQLTHLMHVDYERWQQSIAIENDARRISARPRDRSRSSHPQSHRRRAPEHGRNPAATASKSAPCNSRARCVRSPSRSPISPPPRDKRQRS